MLALVVFIALVVAQRLLELRLARRNEAWAKSRGAIEQAPRHYPLFIVLHSAWLLGILIEGLARAGTLGPLWWLWLAVYALAQVGRYWVIATLGPYWNTRILIVPDGERVTRGPYRFLNHPNYVVVACEVLTGPLIFGAWVTAVLFSLLNAALLLGVRIPAEERALEAYKATKPSGT